MATLTARTVITTELSEPTAFASTQRTIGYRTAVMDVTGIDRRHAEVQSLSAGLSAQQILLAPLGVSAPGSALLLLQTDQPIDVGLGASATLLSGLKLLLFNGVVSSLYVYTGSQVTTLLLDLVGGSNAVVTVSRPVP